MCGPLLTGLSGATLEQILKLLSFSEGERMATDWTAGPSAYKVLLGALKGFPRFQHL
jgi:hypothetical protein